MSTPNVQRPATFRITQDQTTWAIFVAWVILDDRAARKSLLHLRPRDVPQDALLGRVQGVLVLLPLDLAANLFDHPRLAT